MPQFVKDVEAIRRRALEKIEEGAVTSRFQGDVGKTVSILNEALATEVVCVLPLHAPLLHGHRGAWQGRRRRVQGARRPPSAPRSDPRPGRSYGFFCTRKFSVPL